MRLDHIAYRVKDRQKTAEFFQKCFGYEVGTEFRIKFDDGNTAECIALAPPEIRSDQVENWVFHKLTPSHYAGPSDPIYMMDCELHAPPEIFVSDGPEGSIVGDWVAERGGVGGVHHIAYQVDDVAAKMKEWQELGFVEFYSEDPLVCDETHLTQVFSKPSELTGVIYELITRGSDNKGFCELNVKGLMESTKNV